MRFKRSAPGAGSRVGGVELLDRCDNVVFLGLSGVGKSHLAQALAYRAAAVGYRRIGYLSFCREEATLFFNVVAKRYEHGSIVVTSNLAFSQWSSAFAEDQTLTAALLDPLLHHSHIMQLAGDSYRLEDKRKARQPKGKS